MNISVCASKVITVTMNKLHDAALYFGALLVLLSVAVIGIACYHFGRNDGLVEGTKRAVDACVQVMENNK